METDTAAKWVPTYCFNCVSGPDLLTVKVENGVATEVAPNFRGKGIHPGDGKPCVKAYGLIQKTYSPHRILSPMRRTNPKKGIDEDPGFEPISWDEALDIVAAKMREIRARGIIDEAGLPRVAASFGHGGTPSNYMGTFPAFLAAWGPVDFSFGSGQGVSCTHSEHLYGELWHRAFTVCPDTPSCNYVLSFGANIEASAGPDLDPSCLPEGQRYPHDLPAGDNWNIDHVAVGPQGQRWLAAQNDFQRAELLALRQEPGNQRGVLTGVQQRAKDAWRPPTKPEPAAVA